MARSYSAVCVTANQGATTAPLLGAWANVASPPARTRLYEFVIGSDATPADYATRWQIAGCGTAAPTGGGAVTPLVTDPGDTATGCAAMASATGGTTLTRIFMDFGLNMRASFRWVAAPGKEYVSPATQYNGPALVMLAQSTAYAVDATILWEES